jgi:hypothetical protein
MIRAALVLLLALVAAPAAAQQGQPSANPHGPLPAGLDCSACHTAEAWRPVRDTLRFDHGAVRAFALTGAHTQATCVSCHQDLRFDGPDVSPSECVTCHVDPHEGTLAAECTTCHVTTSFQAVDGERVHAGTALPLTGAHAQLPCESCHTNDRGGAFSPLPSDCVACHRSDYQSAATVDHVGAGYPTDCTACHNPVAWQDAPLFDHGAASAGFELLGSHRRITCASCHAVPSMAPLFTPASQEDCVACHRDEYEREHAGSGFATTCASCHTVEGWEGATFDHSATGFELIGRHARLECASCHVGRGGELRFPPPTGTQDCVACHRDDYESEHRGSGFPTTCLSCHAADSWDDARFDHATTDFPLVGAHTSATCATCHGGAGGPPLSTLPTGPQDCVACHRRDYDGAHAGTAIPTSCATCHVPTSWEGASADHTLLSGGFALEGPHRPLACTSCHQVPGYALLFPEPAAPSDCVACHRRDYDEQHRGSGFPTTCLSCHVASTWSGARIDHPQVSGGFRLLGAHATATCTACHAIPGYALLFPAPRGDQDCVACHRDEYQREHAGSGFPQTCATCHTVQSWASTFDHDAQFFRIYSGPHDEKWATCATCHTVPTNFGSFTCLTCHEHQRSEMDDKHREVRNYAYESRQCYSCHRRE